MRTFELLRRAAASWAPWHRLAGLCPDAGGSGRIIPVGPYRTGVRFNFEPVPFSPSEEALLAAALGRPEEGAIELLAGAIQAEAREGLAKALREELGERALAHHARAELGVVLAAVAHVADPR